MCNILRSGSWGRLNFKHLPRLPQGCILYEAYSSNTQPHTRHSSRNGSLERDGFTIMGMTRRQLGEINHPKHVWGEPAATAVFLLNHLAAKAIGGDSTVPHVPQASRSLILEDHAAASFRARWGLHVENFLQPVSRPGEGPLIGFDSDDKTDHPREGSRHRKGSLNLSFIEETPVVEPTTGPTGRIEAYISNFHSNTGRHRFHG